MSDAEDDECGAPRRSSRLSHSPVFSPIGGGALSTPDARPASAPPTSRRRSAPTNNPEGYNQGSGNSGKRARRSNLEAARLKQQLAREEKAEAEKILTDSRTKPGEKMSFIRARCILLLVSSLMVLNYVPGFAAAAKAAAKTLTVAPKFVFDLVARAREVGVAVALDAYRIVRDRRSSNRQKLDPLQYIAIDRLIQSQIVAKQLYITAHGVRDLITEHLGVTISIRHARRILRKMGYKYGKLRKTYQLTAERKVRIERWMREYFEAICLELAGTHKIVWMDESYVHTRHARTMGYSIDREGAVKINGVNVVDDSDQRSGDATNARGQRLIIVHAITRDGLLCAGAQDKRCQWGSTAMDTDYTCAEWVFQADARLKDYHKNMDGFMFKNWVKRMLIPSFVARYGADMKMILILDNAPYHHHHSEDALQLKGLPKSSKPGKKGLADIAADVGLANFSCFRDRPNGGRSFHQFIGNFEVNAPAGPYADELITAIKNHVKKTNPALLYTELDEIFAAHAGWKLIFTPPYCPKFQPIERVWGFTKNDVALEYRANRSLSEVYADVMTVWYGGTGSKTKKAKTGLTKAIVQKFIKASEKDMDKWIEDCAVTLKGSITECTLEDVDDAPVAENAAEDDAEEAMLDDIDEEEALSDDDDADEEENE